MPILPSRRASRTFRSCFHRIPRLEPLEDRTLPSSGAINPAGQAVFANAPPPKLVVSSPAPGATEAQNVTVTGEVTPTLLGVASVTAEVDSGAKFKVSFNAHGVFSFPTSLALDGSADGTHVVHVWAADTFGHTATDKVSFTLDTNLVNEDVTNDPGVQQNPSVAVDPLNSKHIVIAYMDYSLLTTGYAGIGVAVSKDNGTTWTHTSVPLPAEFNQGAANPTVLFDGQGHVFISFMAVTYLGPTTGLTNSDFNVRGAVGTESNNGIFISRSDDGGMTWQQPVAVVSHLYDGTDPVFFETIPNFAIDTFRTLPSGQPNPSYGEQVIVWTRVYPSGEYPGQPTATGGTDIMIAVSRDDGQTFQTQLQNVAGISTPVSVIQDPLYSPDEGGLPLGIGFLDQAHVTIGPIGDIYVSDFGAGDFTVAHSTDGGASFFNPDHSTDLGIAFGNAEDTYVNDAGLGNGNSFRTFSARQIVADPSRPGYVYAVDVILVANQQGSQIDPADVLFARSTDYGQNWTDSFQVGTNLHATVLNDDNGGNSATGLTPDEVISGQAMPRLAVNANGDISVIWYDTRDDPNNHLLNVWGTSSTDGGVSFSANYRLTSVSFDANKGIFTDAVGQPDPYIGDSIGLALSDTTAYAGWTDTRNGNQDIYFTRYPITPAPTPPSDRYQPNNTPVEATNFGTVNKLLTVARLAVPAGSAEWFRIQAAATGNLTASAPQDDTGQQLRLELFTANARTLLASGTNILNPSGKITGQQLVFPGQSGSTYLVEIVHTGPNTGSNGYTLQLQSLTANLGALVQHVASGSLPGGGQAYYLLAAAAAGSIQVTQTAPANIQSNLTLQLLDPATLNVLGTGLVSGITDTASVVAQQGQAILVHLANNSKKKGTYSLELTNLDQFAASGNSTLFIPVPDGPSQVVVGDLTGNGIEDLVVADAASDTVSVLLGNGDGTFQAPRQYAVGSFQVPSPPGAQASLPDYRRPIVLADLTGNGILDIVVANYSSGDVSVLMGRGDGTFEPQRRYDSTSAPFGLAIGDLTGDSIPDIVTVSSHAGTDATVAVLVGRGDGSFLPPTTFPANIGGGYPLSNVTLADLTGNGKLDLILGGSNNPDVTVFLGNGNGTFQPGVTYTAGRLGGGLAVTDINGDGIPDIINTSANPNGVSVLLGNGDGTFTPLLNPNDLLPLFPAGQVPVAVTAGDFGSQVTLPDGLLALGPPDGHPDLIVAASGIALPDGEADGPPEILLVPTLWSNGQFQGFGAPQKLAPAVQPIDVVAADLTGDGGTDIVAVDQQGLIIISDKNTTTPLVKPQADPAPRDLGTVVHLLEPTLTIVPGHEENDYTLTVPTEDAPGAGNEVLDFSGDFQALEGAGITMQVLDASGTVLGSGDRFRVSAPQGAVLTLRVFGLTDKHGNQGSGAYTLDIDVLPQVVSAQAQPLLPGATNNPGGATASLVVTLQGDRLDPTTAQNPSNYIITFLGPNGNQLIPLASGQSVVYDPSTNVDVTSGTTYPTAVKQTITFLFDQALPSGNYQIQISNAVQTAAFNADESGQLAPAKDFNGHPVVTLSAGTITEGTQLQAAGLVQPAGALGDFAVWAHGTPFFQQLHDDLGALLDGALTQGNSDDQITTELLDQITSRFDPALGAAGQRPAQLLVLWTDPVSLDLEDPNDDRLDYNVNNNQLTNGIDNTFVSVVGNIEVVVAAVPGGSPSPNDQQNDSSGSNYTLTVSDVPATARGGVVLLGQNSDQTMSLTDGLQSGTTVFTFGF